MAFKRQDIEALGIDSEKVEILIEWHSETLKALQAKIDDLKSKNEKFAEVQAELDKAKKTIENAESFKTKYETAKAELDKIKAENAAKDARTAKEAALTKELEDMSIGEKWHSRIFKTIDFDTIEMDGDKIKNADKVREAIKSEWGDTIETTKVEGTKTANPPAYGGKSTKTVDEIKAIKNRDERYQAIAENLSQFG